MSSELPWPSADLLKVPAPHGPEMLLRGSPLQNAIFTRAAFLCIATDINAFQFFSVGTELAEMHLVPAWTNGARR